MSDQADVLRTLAAGQVDSPNPTGPGRAPLLLMAGAKGGVGTSTLAVNLSIALAAQGNRAVLVDLDMCRADVAALCGVTEKFTTADVLSARRSIHEVLHRGPGGIQIAAGAWVSPNAVENSSAAHRRLLGELARIGEHADYNLVDIGADLSEVASHYWTAADQILLVTTCDSVAVMDAYASIKVMAKAKADLPVHLLVNQARTSSEAWEVYQRIERSCQRFLGMSIQMAGFVPHDAQVSAAARVRSPLLLSSPACAASQAISRVADGFSAEMNSPASKVAASA